MGRISGESVPMSVLVGMVGVLVGVLVEKRETKGREANGGTGEGLTFYQLGRIWDVPVLVHWGDASVRKLVAQQEAHGSAQEGTHARWKLLGRVEMLEGHFFKKIPLF
jgi:hypothetical protein